MGREAPPAAGKTYKVIIVPAFKTVCLSKTLIAPSVYELRLEKPASFDFKPGQFVLFDVPLLENEDDLQARAYSIASAPSESDLLFVIKLVPNGRASRWIEKRVSRGTAITMKGPFGAFTLDMDTAKAYLFIATGTGIAPLRSQILHIVTDAGFRFLVPFTMHLQHYVLLDLPQIADIRPANLAGAQS